MANDLINNADARSSVKGQYRSVCIEALLPYHADMKVVSDVLKGQAVSLGLAAI